MSPKKTAQLQWGAELYLLQSQTTDDSIGEAHQFPVRIACGP